MRSWSRRRKVSELTHPHLPYLPTAGCASARPALIGNMLCDVRRHRRHPHRPSGRPLHLRHPQYRRRGAKGRGHRHSRPLSEYRRPEPVRLRHPAASDRSRRARDARRPQRLHRVGGDRRGAGSRRRGFAGRGRDASIRIACSSPRAHRKGSSWRSPRSWTRARRCSCRRRRIRSTPRCSPRSAPSRSITAPIPSNRVAAGPRRHPPADHATDARAGGHRSEQPDRRHLSGRACAAS